MGGASAGEPPEKGGDNDHNDNDNGTATDVERQGAKGPAGLHLLLPALASSGPEASRREASNRGDCNERDSHCLAFDGWQQFFSQLLHLVSDLTTFDFLARPIMSFGILVSNSTNSC